MDKRDTLTKLTRALRALHHALVKIERHAYEKEWGTVDPGELLQLLTRHPQFEWLHVLSEFMVDVDELLDEDELREDDVRRILAQARSMISPEPAEATPFSQRYVAALQEDPSLVMAHAAVRQVLDAR